jgi:hypothetical protein
MSGFKKKDVDEMIKNILHDKLSDYITTKVTGEIVKMHHGIKPKTPKQPEKKELKEEAPTVCMGSSSSTSGTGPIDTFDPVLRKKKVEKRKPFNNDTKKD